MLKEYQDIQTGAYGLLYDTTRILNQIGSKYIIVGGWSPYLLNSSPIEHPGTKDVDILFDHGYEKGYLKDIIKELLNQEFILSAKHDFQLFKEINVLGKKFVYNVDLLHPLESVIPEDIYVDHIDLGIPTDIYQSRTFKMKSIALPSAQSLFDNSLFVEHQLKIKTNDGETLSLGFPLMNETGTLITKSKSVSKPKRYRDALDIYLAIKQGKGVDQVSENVLKLKQANVDTYNTLYGIREVYEEGTLLKNTLKYIPKLDCKDFQDTMELFFEKSELNNPAEH